jgi:hypothetical protein
MELITLIDGMIFKQVCCENFASRTDGEMGEGASVQEWVQDYRRVLFGRSGTGTVAQRARPD